MRDVSLTIVLCLCLAPLAQARDIYVDNLAGDDRRTGQEPVSQIPGAGPVRSIAKALRLAQQGDRIVLAASGEPYRECVSLVGSRHSGLSVRPLVIEGNGATLDGSAPVPDSAWQQIAGELFTFRPERLGTQQLFIDGRPAVRRPAPLDFTVPELPELHWCLAQGQIYFRAELDHLPQSYYLSYARHPVGITLYHVHDVEIRNLIVQGYQVDGISAHDAVGGVRLLGVTARGNGRAGVSVSGSSRVELDGCLVGDNGEAQLRVEGHSFTRVSDSDLLDNTAAPYVRAGGRLYIDGVEAGQASEPADAARDEAR